jgi:hypothetical protein
LESLLSVHNSVLRPQFVVLGFPDDTVDQTRFGLGLWPGHSSLAVKPFGYLRDRLFLLGCLLYALNRWGLKPRIHNAFLHDHFNDSLLIACALPPLLYLHRLLKLRAHDCPPTPAEIGFHLAVWSVLFEVIGPRIMPHATGDPWDVVAYVVGGILAGLWWQRHRLVHRGSPAGALTESAHEP